MIQEEALVQVNLFARTDFGTTIERLPLRPIEDTVIGRDHVALLVGRESCRFPCCSATGIGAEERDISLGPKAPVYKSYRSSSIRITQEKSTSEGKLVPLDLRHS